MKGEEELIIKTKQSDNNKTSAQKPKLKLGLFCRYQFLYHRSWGGLKTLKLDCNNSGFSGSKYAIENGEYVQTLW